MFQIVMQRPAWLDKDDAMRRLMKFSAVLGVSAMLLGCPESATDKTRDTTTQPVPTDVANVPTQAAADVPAAPVDRAIEPAVERPVVEPDVEPAQTREAPVVVVDADVPNAVHRIAGRSVFPEAGEKIDKPIADKPMSELSQFTQPVDAADIPDVVPWEQANRYVGYEITVQGKIVDVGLSGDGKVNFLNFHEDWRGKFYLVVFDDLAKTLDKSVSDTFRGKTLRVKGLVEDHRGRPQVKILSMDQVQFVDE